jgi:lysophospholipase L1-like esterase
MAAKANYVYNAGTGLRRWRASLADLQSGGINFIDLPVIGDSIVEGIGAGNNAIDRQTKGFVGVLRTQIARIFEDVGMGMIPQHYVQNYPLWTFTGSWTILYGFGCSNGAKQSIAANDTATLSFNGNGIGIVFVKASGAGSFDVLIDDVINTTIDCNAPYSTAKQEITGLSAGTHILKIVAKTSASIYIVGAYEIKGSKGVRVNMVGKGGATTVQASITSEVLDAEINVWNPPLTIVAIGANDFGDGIALDTYKTNLQTIISRAKNFGDCMLVSTGICIDALSSIAPQSEYVNTMYQLAQQNNCCFVDIYNRWSGDANYVKNTLGLFDDNIHPNKKGHQDIANAIYNALMS